MTADDTPAMIMITETGMISTFPDDQVNSVLALALLARCGMDRETAIRVVKAADREHRRFAAEHPELREH